MRNALRVMLLPALLIVIPVTASADPWKDESGHGHRRGHKHREYKEEYWDGNCKVERKVGKHGEYKEERKCRGPQYRYHEPAPVYVPVPPPAYRREPGIIIDGTIRLP